MSENYCKFCNRHFRYKDLFDQHEPTCEFFYRSEREHDRETDATEVLPSNQNQYKLIQHLMLTVNRLTKDVERLKKNTIVRKKKMIMDYINKASYPKPPKPFEEWVLNLTTTPVNLQCVFDGDLTDGIQDVLRSHMETIPICAFHQKSATLYVFSSRENLKWRIMTHDEFERIMQQASHKLLQEFLRWQIANEVHIQMNPTLKEKNIEYMQRINGISIRYEDKRRSECKKWLFDKLATDFTHNVEYEFV
jgi:hypothetical protein